MKEFVIRIFIYLICFLISIYGLNALDFNRLLKKNKVNQAWILYILLACIMAYLFGQFIMSITYYFY